MAVKDKIVAAVNSKSGASLNLYNTSKTTAAKAPWLVHYIPLDMATSLPPSAPLLVPSLPKP